MGHQAGADVTVLLEQIRGGDDEARARLLDRVYTELRQIAAGFMSHERVNHTLQTTALVHEAAIRLLNQDALTNLENRANFFAAAARAMRQILVDYARAHGAKKRGGDWGRVELSEECAVGETREVDEALLDDALGKLETFNARQARVVELRRYGGLKSKEIAEMLGISERTEQGDFRAAKAWLLGEMTRDSCG